MQWSMSRAGGLSRNSDSTADHRDRGSYTSPTLPCGSYPFVNLREADTLLRKLSASRKSEKYVRQHTERRNGSNRICQYRLHDTRPHFPGAAHSGKSRTLYN